MFALILAAAFSLPPQKSDAVIGVTAVHLESGRRVSVRGSERFPMGSVYKLPIALTVLRRAETGTISLDRQITIEPKDFSPGYSPLRDNARGKAVTLTIGELLRRTVEVSDNTTSDVLLRLVGPPAVALRMAELGFGGIHINRQEREIAADLKKPGGVERYWTDARDTVTPDDMAALMTAIFQSRHGLSRATHEKLLRWMTATRTGSRRIKYVLPAGWTIAHKTGTMPGVVNDAAILTSPDEKQHVILVVSTKRGTSEESIREADLAAVARAAFEAVTRPAAK